MTSCTLSLSPGSAPPVTSELPRFQGGTNDFLWPPRGFGPETPNGGDGKEEANDNAASLCRRFGAMVVVVVGSNLLLNNETVRSSQTCPKCPKR